MVARTAGGREVAGSNPVAPIWQAPAFPIKKRGGGRYHYARPPSPVFLLSLSFSVLRYSYFTVIFILVFTPFNAVA